ncbi:MAG: hypothetical protein ABSB74_04000 [Tepidisphaeraceae bacterium]
MSTDAQSRLVDLLDRIGKVLGAIYASTLHELDAGSKADRLSRCGFSNTEIADLLGSTANSINVALHKSRHKKQKKAKKK